MKTETQPLWTGNICRLVLGECKNRGYSQANIARRMGIAKVTLTALKKNNGSMTPNNVRAFMQITQSLGIADPQGNIVSNDMPLDWDTEIPLPVPARVHREKYTPLVLASPDADHALCPNCRIKLLGVHRALKDHGVDLYLDRIKQELAEDLAEYQATRTQTPMAAETPTKNVLIQQPHERELPKKF